MKALLIRILKFIIFIFESLNSKFSINPHFYTTKDFPWIKEIENSYDDIRNEYANYTGRADIPYMDDLSQAQKTIVEKYKWKSLFLVCYGRDVQSNISSFPKTHAALLKIPGLRTALFSVLEPHAHLTPHRGPYNGVLRYHLALMIPDDFTKCGISIHNETRHWKEGESMVFDDTFIHEAWNHTDSPRVVLFVDFLRPLPRLLQWLNKRVVDLISRSPFINEIMENIEKEK